LIFILEKWVSTNSNAQFVSGDLYEPISDDDFLPDLISVEDDDEDVPYASIGER
jgi:hypothetical protein